jgi:zinc transporter, ZIP family
VPWLSGVLVLLGVVAATLGGGMLPLRFEQHSRVFLSFSAGTLVALALLELIPEGLAGRPEHTHRLLLLVLAAFLATLLLDKLHVLHPHEHGMDSTCPHVEHEHPPLAMHGALGLILHSAVDGLALAAALRESFAAAVAVGVALSAHKLADGLTTVALVLSHHHHRPQAVRVLIANVAALCVGFAAGVVAPLDESGLSALLLVMAGFFLYLGATDLLPAVTTPRCRKRDVLATAFGMAAIALVSLLAH